MTVLCLMYHHTPAGSPETQWDVPLNVFRHGIKELLDFGAHFVDLSQASESAIIRDRLSVAITFDDGHVSNAAAIEYLAKYSIRPSAFIVKDWSLGKANYLGASALVELSKIADFGSHGATHTALTLLNQKSLYDELRSSRDYLEEILGRRIDSLALPGGKGHRKIFEAARSSGYRVVCTSIEDVNYRTSFLVNRVCISQFNKHTSPLAFAEASQNFWRMRRVRRTLNRAGAAFLGENRTTYVSSLLRRIQGDADRML